MLLMFSHSVMSHSLWPHGLWHTRLPYSLPSPRVCSNSCPLSQWCHPTISSSVIPFSSCLKSFPASGSFPMSQFFASGGPSIGVSASSSTVIQFSCSVVSDSLRPHEPQHTRPPCPSPTPGVHPNSCPLSCNAIQPSHPLSSPSPPVFNLSQHQGLFKWVSSSHQGAKVLEFQLQHQSFQWTPRTDLL